MNKSNSQRDFIHNEELPFSVLMPVYINDSPIYFDKAIDSIYCKQSIKPAEIVIVIDGPISNELKLIIDKWVAQNINIFKVLKLEFNLGLGKALNIGMSNCKYDLIARMDSDDIAHKDRFKFQVNAFKENTELDICGTNIAEFSLDPNEISGIRALPMLHSDIVSISKFRNPINHPSVMFKKLKIEEVNGYQDMPYFEDYYLWIRCIQGGCIFHNIQKNLVLMRGGDPQLVRRKGIKYAIYELKFLSKLREMKFIKLDVFLTNVVIRFLVRLFPKPLVKFSYTIIRKIY